MAFLKLFLVDNVAIFLHCRIKDGRELIDSVRLKQSRADIKKDEFGLSLTIADAEMTDSGVFEVVAKNSQGKASNSARLTVKSERTLIYNVMCVQGHRVRAYISRRFQTQ